MQLKHSIENPLIQPFWFLFFFFFIYIWKKPTQSSSVLFYLLWSKLYCRFEIKIFEEKRKWIAVRCLDERKKKSREYFDISDMIGWMENAEKEKGRRIKKKTSIEIYMQWIKINWHVFHSSETELQIRKTKFFLFVCQRFRHLFLFQMPYWIVKFFYKVVAFYIFRLSFIIYFTNTCAEFFMFFYLLKKFNYDRWILFVLIFFLFFFLCRFVDRKSLKSSWDWKTLTAVGFFNSVSHHMKNAKGETKIHFQNKNKIKVMLTNSQCRY